MLIPRRGSLTDSNDSQCVRTDTQVSRADHFHADDLIAVSTPFLALSLKSALQKSESEMKAPEEVPAPVQEKPRDTGNRVRFAAFLRRLQGDAPYDGVDVAGVPVDTQGFQSPDNVRFFANIFHAFRPSCLLELGSWKGTSAIMFAKYMLAYCNAPVIGCIDTWLGSLEHWTNPEWREQLGLRQGYPTLHECFRANVIRAGLAPYITPLPMTTKTGIALVRRDGIQVDAVYVDASHEYAEVLDDLRGVWHLVGDEGIIIVDDYKTRDVQRALLEFCSRPGIYGLYNADSGWPEAMILKNAAMRDKAVAGHPALIEFKC
jgi:hypothetical protein